MTHDAPLKIRAWTPDDLPAMTGIWNDVVRQADAFPQTDPLTPAEALPFFSSQTFAGVAERGDRLVGLYILHPNNIGRCAHIANASFAVDPACRHQGIGEALVRHCLACAKEWGFAILQFNAVVATNTAAIRLYDKLGFTRLGQIPGGFRRDEHIFEDILLFYHPL